MESAIQTIAAVVAVVLLYEIFRAVRKWPDTIPDNQIVPYGLYVVESRILHDTDELKISEVFQSLSLPSAWGDDKKSFWNDGTWIRRNSDGERVGEACYRAFYDLRAAKMFFESQTSGRYAKFAAQSFLWALPMTKSAVLAAETIPQLLHSGCLLCESKLTVAEEVKAA